MKHISPALLKLLAVGLMLGAALPNARAQIPWATDAFSRQNKTEVYGIGQYLHQGDTTFPGPFVDGTKLKLDDTGLGGIGLAFHFSDFFSIHGDFMFGPATLRAEAPGGSSFTLGEDTFLQTGRFNLDYNIINRRLTPFITAGIGYQYLQVDQHGHHNGFYYYDSSYWETDFTWNVGAGLRWNITDHFFLKLTGGAQWLQYQDANNITTQIEAFLALGGTF